LIRVDDVDAAAAASRADRRAGVAAAGRLGKPAEPWPDRRKRAHKAARPKQLTPRPATDGQKAVEPLLLHFVHVQQAVRRPLVKHAVLDVFAKDPRPFFVSTTKEAAAIVDMACRLALGPMIVLMRHGNPYATIPSVRTDYLEPGALRYSSL